MTVAEIMEAVKELKVMELSELVKALEEEFGVSATPVAVAGGAAAGDGAAAGHLYSGADDGAAESADEVNGGRL